MEERLLGDQVRAEMDEDDDALRVSTRAIRDWNDWRSYVEDWIRTHPGCSTEEFLVDITLLGLGDFVPTADSSLPTMTGACTIMTVHAAKGLEASRVYVIGMEEDLFPLRPRAGSVRSWRHVSPIKHYAEELRLCYVAITRARDSLTLCTASYRVLQQREVTGRPSRYLASLPETSHLRTRCAAPTSTPNA
jgi:superfamily I DNA/RNA helicase